MPPWDARCDKPGATFFPDTEWYKPVYTERVRLVARAVGSWATGGAARLLAGTHHPRLAVARPTCARPSLLPSTPPPAGAVARVRPRLCPRSRPRGGCCPHPEPRGSRCALPQPRPDAGAGAHPRARARQRRRRRRQRRFCCPGRPREPSAAALKAALVLM